MNKDFITFGAGFTAGSLGALGQLVTNPHPTFAQWALALMTAFAGGFAALSGKQFNAGQDKKTLEIKAQGVAEAIADPLHPLTSTPTQVTVVNTPTDPVPVTDQEDK